MDSDGELLHRALKGDSGAFSSLYRRRQGAIYRYAMHMSGSAATAEDVTQEVFLALLREQAGYNAARGSVAAYLIGMARHIVWKKTARDRNMVPLDGNGNGDGDWQESRLASPLDLLGDLTKREAIEDLRQAVLQLPPVFREAVVLCELEEMSYAEAAEALQCPIGTVRSRLARARRMLAERLAGRTEAARCRA